MLFPACQGQTDPQSRPGWTRRQPYLWHGQDDRLGTPIWQFAPLAAAVGPPWGAWIEWDWLWAKSAECLEPL